MKDFMACYHLTRFSLCLDLLAFPVEMLNDSESRTINPKSYLF